MEELQVKDGIWVSATALKLKGRNGKDNKMAVGSKLETMEERVTRIDSGRQLHTTVTVREEGAE